MKRFRQMWLVGFVFVLVAPEWLHADVAPWTAAFSGEPDDSLVRRLTVAEVDAAPAGLELRQTAQSVEGQQAAVVRSMLRNPADAPQRSGPVTLAEWAFRGDGGHNDGYGLLKHNDDVWYDSTFWQGGERWVRVGKDWHHPGENAPSIRRFTAPRDGTVRITGRVYKADPNGDGVGATILHNDQQLWRHELAGNDGEGVEANLELAVKAGDSVRFVVDNLTTIWSDTTHWDPVITYADGQVYRASEAFAQRRQGAGNWWYEAPSDEEAESSPPVSLFWFDANWFLRSAPVATGKSMVLSHETAQPLAVLADEHDQSGAVLVIDGDGPWQIEAARSDDGRVSVRVVASAAAEVAPNQSVDLPTVTLGAYHGTSLNGVARVSRWLGEEKEGTVPITELRRRFEAVGVAELDYWVMIQQDWQRQDGVDPLRPETFAAATDAHLAKTQQLLNHLQAAHGAEFLAGEADRLTQLAADANADAASRYLHLRILKRRIALSNPLVDFGKLMFTKRVPTSYSHLVMQHYGWRARPGGGLFILEEPGRSLRARDILEKVSGTVSQNGPEGAAQKRFLTPFPAALYSPEWVRVMLAAGDRIDFRPRIHEAVAPYVTPNTPETRNLSDEESRAALELDWLHQAGQDTAPMRVQGGRTWYSNAPVSTASPTPERIREEIVRTRELAARIASHHPERVTFAEELAKVAELEQKAAGLTEGDRELYFQIRQIKRGIMFRNPVIDFDQLLFIDKPYPQGREWQHETRHRLGYQAVPGGRLLVLEGLQPGGNLRQLMPQPPLHGSFWRPDLSFDGTKIVFSYKPHNEKAYHLYEIGVDGSGLRQLTDGIYDDFDPIYLPDGHLMFSTTRGHTYVRCMPPTNAFPLARCDADGKNIYLVSRNNEPDYLPSVMNDGRVIYTRWEYTDKPLWRAQGLWTVNPDGTQVQAFWGNQTVWPDLLKDARAIPGSRRVMFTGSAHHNWFAGTVGIIDPDKGFNFPDGLTKVTAELAYPESGNGPVDPIESPNYRASGAYSAYYSPYPLSEEDFLVSANRGGKFVLYLMDIDGNRELLYEGTHNIFYAMPLRARSRPPVIADRVAWPSREERNSPKPGVIYSANVYYGAPPEIRDKARFLRVLNIEHKTYTYWHRRPYLSTGPVVSAVQSEGVKHIFGTVPIEKDGSVAFEAPAGFPLHFQLLDEEYRAMQTMRSFTGVMPGEQRGCLGCHESHSRTPSFEAQPTLALRAGPRTIDPPPWGDASISFPRFVQPVLDQYCGKCHQGDGEGRKVVDFTDRPGFLIFSEPYMLLTGRPAWGRPYELPENPPPGFGIADILHVEGYDQLDPVAYQTPAPMTALSYRSRLIDIASSGKHHDVKVDSLSLQKLIAWVDTMAPYRGTEEVRELDDPEFQGIDWLSIRPRVKTAPIIVRPGPVD